MLRTGPYGKWVCKSDDDICDHQVRISSGNNCALKGQTTDSLYWAARFYILIHISFRVVSQSVRFNEYFGS